VKVGFVVTHPPHESMGSIVRVKEFSRHLSKFGHQVHILSPFKFKQNWGKNVFFHKIKTIPRGSISTEKMYSFLRKILNVPLFARNIILRERILNRIINSLSKAILEFLNNSHLELDLIQGEQEIAAAALINLESILSCPVIVDLHNIWPEELIVAGIIGRESKQYKILVDIERRIIESAGAIVCVSSYMRDYIAERYGADKNKTFIVEPGGTSRRVKPANRKKPPKAIYAGLVARREHVDLFIESIPYVLAKIRDAEFYITNKGEYLRKIKILARKLNTNPKFFWIPEEEKFFEFLSNFFVGVLPSTNDIPRKMGTPVKLFDYLSVGVPVVANDIGTWTEIIRKERVGILTNDDPKEFADAITFFLHNPEESFKTGEQGINLIKTKYNWEFSTKKLISFYKKYL